MNKIRIIDLLNKIANNEEIPKEIRFDGKYWEKVYGEKYPYYTNDWGDLFIYFFKKNLTFTLNDEIEIIEDTPKISKLYINNKLQYDLAPKEDEKIETINNFISNVGAVDENNIEEYIHKLFEQEFILFSKIEEIINYINKGDK